MGDSVDFVTKFHSLEGNLLGERKKNFSKFLRELASAGDQQIELFFKNLDPQTYLEKLFKVDALIYFKRTSEMLDILKGDNEIYRAKVMKQQWFFEKTFKNTDAESLVNEFIPQLPFKDRRKFVNRVLRTMDEKQVDLVFAALYTRYGLWFAKNFVHLCSAEKIKDFLQNQEINLQPNQVIHLFDKNEELFLNYLDYYKSTFGKAYNERKVTDHIALTNLDLVINLNEEEKIILGQLGRRTSKKGFEVMKKGILEDTCKTSLNKNVMYRKLGNQFKSYYYERFPKFSDDVSVRHEFSMLQSIPKSKRWPIFFETFLKRFPDHDIKNISISDIVKYCPDINIIKTRALEVYNEDKNENWLQYVEPKLSIPLLKEKINVTSDINDRKRLLMLLIETCAENKDFVSFEAVLKYICYRHRNEDNEFRNAILYKIKQLFNLQDLNESHWNYLNELIKIKKVQQQFQWYSDSPFVEGYLEYLFRNNKDFSVAMQEYVKDIKVHGCFELTGIKDPVIAEKILIEFLKVLRTIDTYDHFLNCNIIESMISFNELHPQHSVMYSNFSKFDQIVADIFAKTSDIFYYEQTLIEKLILHKILFPESLPMINNSAIRQGILNVALEPQSGQLLSQALNAFILKKSRTAFENDLLTVYFELLLDKYPASNVVDWYLVNEPQTIVIHFPKIVGHCPHTLTDSKLLLIKFYSQFKFDTQVIDYLKQKLTNVAYDKKIYYLNRLRMMLNTDEFTQIITGQFLPEKEKLDLTDGTMMEIYKVQCDIAKSLHKVEEPHKMLQIVFKFCVGDYLQSALPSLYGIFYKSPEINLYSCVEELSKKAVSVNKHSVFLSCELLTQEFIINILTNTKHTNVSSQKHLFKAALKYFQKNPSEVLLNIVIDTMSTIDKNDNEALNSLVATTVPKLFKVPYIEKCWSFYESLQTLGVYVNGYLTSIITHLLNDIDLLKNVSVAFIQNTLNSCLPSEKLSNIMDFAAKVLIYRKHEQIENLDLIFRMVSTKGPAKTRSFLELFITEQLDIEFVSLLDQYWHKYLTITDNFWGHLYLKLWLKDVAKVSEEKFAEDIANFLEQLISQYGFYAFIFFQDVFNRLLDKENDEYKYKLFCNILKFKTNADTCILILNIMAPASPKQCEHTELFQKIMDVIRNVKEPIVSICYSKYLSDHDISIP